MIYPPRSEIVQKSLGSFAIDGYFKTETLSQTNRHRLRRVHGGRVEEVEEAEEEEEKHYVPYYL